MEVVGGVASVIAIVDLTAKIAKICVGYINEAREYEVEIKALNDRVQSLGKVLEELDGLLKGPHQEKLKTSLQLQDTLIACRDELQSLVDRINQAHSVTPNQPGPSNNPSKGFRKLFEPLKKGAKGAKVSAAVRVLVWPIEKADIGKIILRLEGTENVIRFALQIDQTKVILDVDVKLNLVNLPVAEGASFGWYGDEHEPKCLPSTREELLKKIDDWVNGSSGKHMFWLSGAAGTGKSTIARTVAETYQQAGLLGASFFFRRGAGDRANASKLFTTLATNLMQHIPAIRAIVSTAIEQEPDIPKKVLKEQFDKLIFQPILSCKYQGRIVLVIDALDECDNDKDVLTIVKLLDLMKDLKNSDIRIFITSRREVFIKAGFQRISGDFQDLILHDIEEQKILHDITVFLEHELTKIKTEHIYSDTLPPNWPTQSNVETLAKMACPLFIVASTICRFIEEPETLPGHQLTEILKSQHKIVDANPEKSLRLTYLQIINQRVKNKTSFQITEILKEFQDIIGTIVLLQTPLSRASLSQLTNIDERKIQVRLDGFHSVLHLPETPDGVIKTFHLSFREFLLDPQTKENSALWIEECRVHKNIAEWCINLMKKHLRKNICDLPSPAHLREYITLDIIQKRFPPELQYACKYWAYHLMHSRQDICNDGTCHNFLLDYVLEWLEATSILRVNFYNIHAILGLESVTSREYGDQISKLLYDIRRFIRYNYEVIDRTPLQTYTSALLFSPENCLLRQRFYPMYLDWVQQGPQVSRDWGRLLQTIYTDSMYVTHGSRALAFSPNGEIVTVTGRRGAETWDLKTGALVKSDPTFGSLLLYSSNGAWIAVTVAKKVIVILDTLTEIEVKRITSGPNCEYQWPIAFSPNCRYFLSAAGTYPRDDASCGADVLQSGFSLWDTVNWKCTRQWQYKGPHRGMFSQDSSLVVLWASLEGLELWDVESGDCLQKVGTDDTALVEFSPNRDFLALTGRRLVPRSSVTDPVFLDVLQLTSRRLKMVCSIHHPAKHINQAVFLSDAEIAVPDESTGTISIWSALSGSYIRTVSHASGIHDNEYFIAISPDRQYLATFSAVDNSLKLWDSSWLTEPSEEECKAQKTVEVGRHSKNIDFLILSVTCDLIVSVANGDNPEVFLWRIIHDRVVFHVRLDGGWDEEKGAPATKSDDEIEDANIYAGAFSWDGKFLALVDNRGSKLGIWDTESGKIVSAYEMREGEPSNKPEWNRPRLAFSQDSRLLSVRIGEQDPTLIIDLKSYAEPIELWAIAEFNFLAFSTQGDILAFVTSSSCQLWCTERWVAIKTIPQGLGIINPGSYRSLSSEMRGLLSKLTDIWELEYDGEFGKKILKFDLRGSFPISKYIGDRCAEWEEGWVIQNGIRALWVPPAFRGESSDHWHICGDTIASIVVGSSKNISLLRFKYPVS